ncbi:hypothetical protein M0R45_019645 [Rubus argutus]|uniref:Uncharacterized protein n=1 Tax=Rubus argutus TaxID=59490 RepID=A0AAW1X817_RUBAR
MEAERSYGGHGIGDAVKTRFGLERCTGLLCGWVMMVYDGRGDLVFWQGLDFGEVHGLVLVVENGSRGVDEDGEVRLLNCGEVMG